MVKITENDKKIWRRDSVKKALRISIPGRNILLGNSDIYWEKFELTEILENEDQLTFTGCNASRVKFECVALAEDVRGEYIEISIVAEGTKPIELFHGYIDDQERQSAQDLSCKITAYDRIYKLRALNVSSWYENLSFPMSLLQFRNSLAAVCEIEVEPTNLIFDNLQITKTLSTTEIGAVDIWKSICMINGVYGRINRSGKFEFLNLENKKAIYPAESLYPSEDIYPNDNGKAQFGISRYKKIKYEEYYVSKIDKVQIHESENDIGGIYGTGTNAFIVEDNFLTFGRSASELESMAQIIYTKISDYDYIPAQIVAPGLPYMEVGDAIEIKTRKRNVATFIFERTLKGIQVLEDKYEAKGSKVRRKAVEDVNYKVEQIKSRTNKLTRTVESLTSEIYENDPATGEKRSRIEQNAEEISARVEKQGGSQSFSWELLADGFVLKCGDREVFRCDANGITVSGYATAGQINAINTNIQNLYANEAQLGNLIADKASINSLNATNATVSSLNTNVANLNTVVAGKLSANELASNIAGLNYVSVKNLGCNVFNVSANGRAYTLRPAQVAIGGKQRIALIADV